MTSRLTRGLVVVLTLVSACAPDSSLATEVEPTASAAAEALCPVMWTWVKDVGEAFNKASADVAGIESADGRRERWRGSFDEMEALNDELGKTIRQWTDHEVLGPIVAEILRDLPRSDAEIDDLRKLLESNPEIDDLRHQARTQQLIVRVEKVIDLPKPDLGELDADGTLIPAFREVPACQQSIRDVDDGTPQANG